MTKILVATNNPTKYKSLIRGLGTLKGIQFCSLADFPPIPDYDEIGNSYKEIAIAKAKYYAEKTQTITISDDSGLFVSAFPDKFGIKSRREFGEAGMDDMEWLRLFIDLMEDEEDQTAKIQTTLCLYNPNDKNTHITYAELPGEIEAFPQAPIPKGGPFDTIFTPDDAEDVLANLPEKWLNKYDQRTLAAQEMAQYITSQF